MEKIRETVSVIVWLSSAEFAQSRSDLLILNNPMVQIRYHKLNGLKTKSVSTLSSLLAAG